MYKAQLNIGSVSSPTVGGGWVDVNCILDNASISRKKSKELFSRTELSGKLIFYGDEMAALKSLIASTSKVGLKIIHTDNDSVSTDVYEGELNLLGKYTIGFCELKAVTNDEYATILDKKGEKYNILNATPYVVCNCTTSERRLEFSFATSGKVGAALFFTWAALSPLYAREIRTYEDWLAQSLIGTAGWVEATDVTTPEGYTAIARSWAEAFDTPVNGDFYEYNGVVSGTINDQVTIPVVNIEGTYLGTTSTSKTIYLRNVAYYGSVAFEHTRFRRLDQVLKAMIANMDSTVTVNNNSFATLYSDDRTKHLLIASAKDCDITSGSEPTAAEKAEISFSDMMIFLYDFMKFRWKIDTTWQIVHLSDVNYAANFDATAYKGKNWTENEYEYDGEKYSFIRREMIWDNPDFRGIDLEFTKLANLNNDRVISSGKIVTDIWDVHGGDFSDSNLVLVAANLQEAAVDLTNGAEAGGEEFDTFTKTGYDVYLERTTDVSSYAYGNTFSATKGKAVVIEVTCAYTTGSGLEFLLLTQASGGGSGAAAKSNIVEVEEGLNIITLEPTETDTMRLYLRHTGTDDVTATLTGMVFGDEFDVRMAQGAVTNEIVANAELSISNLDEDLNLWDLPAVPKVNGQTTVINTTRLKRDKEVSFEIPIYKPTEVSDTELIVTDAGNMEFDSLDIDLSGKKTVLKGFV